MRTRDERISINTAPGPTIAPATRTRAPAGAAVQWCSIFIASMRMSGASGDAVAGGDENLETLRASARRFRA
jgi:hypothetical protein